MDSINKSSETLLKELELEAEIRNELSDVTVYFDFVWRDSSGMPSLSVITISRVHGQRFLFHKTYSSTTNENSKVYCLEAMLRYIKSDYKKNLLHYTIEWAPKSDTRVIQTSWFHGSSLLEIMDKFYYLKNPHEISVFDIRLNPES